MSPTATAPPRHPQMGFPGVTACGWALPDPWRRGSPSLHLQHQAETHQGRDTAGALPHPPPAIVPGTGDKHSRHTRSCSAALGSCGMEEGCQCSHGSGGLGWGSPSATAVTRGPVGRTPLSLRGRLQPRPYLCPSPSPAGRDEQQPTTLVLALTATEGMGEGSGGTRAW